MLKQTASLENLIERLMTSPLFNLSLSSKELFHSNLLAWLCQLYPDQIGRIFGSFLKVPPQTYQGLKVYRERDHIDLTLEFPHGEKLFIENKVKSLPYTAQLESYTANVTDRNNTNFLLLTLTQPFFLDSNTQTIPLRNGTIWFYLNYQDLSHKLLNVHSVISSINSYHGQILYDYIDFISCLNDLYKRFTIDWENNKENFFRTMQDSNCLKSIRLHDLIDKLLYAQLAARVEQYLTIQEFCVVRGNVLHAQEDQVFIGSGMTRGTGFFDLKYILISNDLFTKPIILGIQLQGYSFRLVFEFDDKKKACIIAECLLSSQDGKQLWFDFSEVPGVSQEYPKKSSFNQFGGTFFYRSKTLSEIRPHTLVDLIVSYTCVIRRNKDLLRRQVEEAVL